MSRKILLLRTDSKYVQQSNQPSDEANEELSKEPKLSEDPSKEPNDNPQQTKTDPNQSKANQLNKKQHEMAGLSGKPTLTKMVMET